MNKQLTDKEKKMRKFIDDQEAYVCLTNIPEQAANGDAYYSEWEQEKLSISGGDKGIFNRSIDIIYRLSADNNSFAIYSGKKKGQLIYFRALKNDPEKERIVKLFDDFNKNIDEYKRKEELTLIIERLKDSGK